jgi:hypothetical protein
MAYTGGLLNGLNDKLGISAANRTVPIAKLIKVHKPKSHEEVVNLIKWHSENVCECGIVSKGTIETFGADLHKAQKDYFGVYLFTLQECILFEYNLFVIQSLKGINIENKAIDILNEKFTNFSFTEAVGYLDEKFRIDIIINANDVEIGGIQVKPNTYKQVSQRIITINEDANQKWGKDVYYLYYDDDENFINFDELTSFISNL